MTECNLCRINTKIYNSKILSTREMNIVSKAIIKLHDGEDG